MSPHGMDGGTGPPRLTTYLRYYTNVAQKPDISKYDFNLVLEKKREERKKRIRESGVTWSKIKGQVEKLAKEKEVSFECYLREVFDVARMIAPEVDARDEMATMLFVLFYKERQVTIQAKTRVQQVAGQVKMALLERVHKALHNIADIVGQEVLEECITKLESSSYKCPMFGANIKVGPICVKPELPSVERLLNFEKLKPVSKATLNYDDYKPPIEVPSEKPAKRRTDVYDRLWLENEMRKYYADVSMIPELANGTYNLLLTSKSNEELQNELFDFLGFDRFALIQNLLEKRSQIKAAPPDKVVQVNQILDSLEKVNDQPAFGSKVMVMSETEKQYLKQARKEEKKLLRSAKQAVEDDSIQDINLEELRAKREEALLNASQTTLFSQRIVHTQPELNFPYVFDEHNKAKKTAGFIAGSKMTLPENFQRTIDSIKEEIEIPVNSPPPLEVGSKLIPVEELDHVGKVAFGHCKTLNRIQTIVFPSAYHSNENLLICAPTGAGKTNIAMLTVVHQIRNHMENNVIQKDKFKVVYIAPMKALAAEMARNFGKRLELLGLNVRELTGDMHMTKAEILATNMIITTPEKWDVTTRKPGDTQLSQLVKLLIIDEVHLLHGDRGPVLETIVARTLRMVESQQSMIRIVGLSATLPNYIDVATFLRVNPYKGLFYFDGRFRPVPLGLTFTGVRTMGRMKQMEDIDRVAYEKAASFVEREHQVMIFVHARNGTLRTAESMIRIAQEMGDTKMFLPEDAGETTMARKSLAKSRNKKLAELFENGFGVHHAGLLRQDRNLIENLFSKGLIKVLVCTATLAWGVNLPAHAVIIKGTDIYDSKHGTMVDLGILDVLQIFGRAGRPQFDTSGHGTIITTHEKLAHYLGLLTNQYPIESSFISYLADNLNAEISLGNVTNIEEAVEWLSYTYLYVRMRKNPQVYGILYKELQQDHDLLQFRRDLLTKAAQALDKAHMVRFDEGNGYLCITDLGRVASQFYIKYDTIEIFNSFLQTVMNESDILALVSQSTEFAQIKVRDEEMQELDELHNQCEVPAKGGVENIHGKVNILLQMHISRMRIDGFSLISDMNYISDNSGRIMRALFEIVLHKNWALMASRFLTMAKMLEQQIWYYQSPMRQFKRLSPEILDKIENSRLSMEKIRDMDHREIGKMIRHEKMGKEVKSAAWQFPLLEMNATIQPITRTVLRINLTIVADFTWNDKVHGSAENYWIWVEDPNTNNMYHREQFTLTKKQVIKEEEQKLVFTIPIFEPLPPQYYVQAFSDKWLGCESSCVLNFQSLILPERHPPNTDLLDLEPLPITALNDYKLEMLFKFTHFNPIQTQIFFSLYHTDENILLGAPTGSGKTIAAEIAMFRVFREQPDCKVVYIAPLKALVRERVNDWKVRLGANLRKNVVELTGDVTPDVRAIQNSHVIITTPEKWDGISRSWQTRNYVKKVALIVIDEIHLLGEDRGPVLEVIVSRTNFISNHTTRNLRIIGLSTALANARDLGDWLGIKELGLFNFRPSVRPVPLEVHIAGFPGKHYCPRMATMNKPTFQAIKQHSPEKPVLVFVSSRRQTRLTALDLMGLVVTDSNPKQWLHMPEHEMEQIQTNVRDENLRLCLSFGIGLHHAGLHEKDRKVCEELFINQKIQILITTATLAWGVNFPAHLVVVKGTEYHDAKTRRYVDMPITDVLQMMGRAGRPQFDNQGVAVILVHDQKKHFYKKFLYEPFPVESSLMNVLPDHLNAEIVASTVGTKQDAIDYLTWTYFFRRLLQNPTYYGLEIEESDPDMNIINQFLSQKINQSLMELESSYCISIEEDNRTIQSTPLGRIASFYYLSHLTVRLFYDELNKDFNLEQILNLLTKVEEYSELPVRHNEDLLNEDLAKKCPIKVNHYTYDSPHTKAHLLLQAHMSHLQLPCVDYLTDTKSVMDQAMRILQAMLDVCGSAGWLLPGLEIIIIMQMIMQARWHTDCTILALPFIESHMLYAFKHKNRVIYSLPDLMNIVGNNYETLAVMLRDELEEGKIELVFRTLIQLPILDVRVTITGGPENDLYKPNMKSSKENRNEKDWLRLQPNVEYSVLISLSRVNKTKDLKVHAPKFSKHKDEGWVVLLGFPDYSELLCLKRLPGIKDKKTHSLSFQTPSEPGRHVLTVFVMSDSYLGLDQQYDIPIEIIRSGKSFSLPTKDVNFDKYVPPVIDDKQDLFKSSNLSHNIAKSNPEPKHSEETMQPNEMEVERGNASNPKQQRRRNRNRKGPRESQGQQDNAW